MHVITPLVLTGVGVTPKTPSTTTNECLLPVYLISRIIYCCCDVAYGMSLSCPQVHLSA